MAVRGYYQNDATYLHSALIPMGDAQVQPLPSLHLRASAARTLLLQHSDEGMRQVLC